ncbi:MAG: hypothetical protein K2R98_15215 [Gemmataceae bacterium]|nr:hypothetical protein [Gemmataceae bacterium]
MNRRQMQRVFEQSILPRVESHARIQFRATRCPATREDQIAEAIGLAFKWFRQLVRRRKDATKFPCTLATFAVKAVRSGRRVCGQLKPKDVLSERAQQQRGFYVGKLPDVSTLETNPLMEALIDNRISPVPDQVAFRIDWPAWLLTRTARDRRLIRQMGMHERTTDLSRSFGLSPARISQLRQEFHRSWCVFVESDPIG